MTPEERHLWYDFLSKSNMKAKRQKVLYNYILDFYIPEVRIAIELDGRQHGREENRYADCERDSFLSKEGIMVLRYTNIQINENFQSVCKDILKHCEMRKGACMKYELNEALPIHKDAIYHIKKSSVISYVEKIWGWDEEFQRNDFERDFSNIEQFSVIKVDEKICGFVQIYEHDNTIELVEIHLIPEKQGNGIGSNIIQKLLERAKNENKTFRLGCFKENIRAKKLYLKLGFVLTETTDTHNIFVYR